MTFFYKYLPSQYVNAFLNEGQILFRTLKHFRNYEDAIRGDEYEGIRDFAPDNGLEITLSNGHKFTANAAFQSRVNNENDIFIFCMSNTLNRDLAKAFKSDCCIQILNVEKFTSKIRNSLRLRSAIQDKRLLHDKVSYYDNNTTVLTDWALPEKISFSKRKMFKEQDEYRLAFSRGDGFKIFNTSQTLIFGSPPESVRDENSDQILLKIGNISKICKVINFSQSE